MTMATSMTTSAEPMPILSRVERLDLMMSYLEEIKGRMDVRNLSCASTTSSGTATTMSDGGNSSVNSTPKSIEKRCRPIDDAVVETQMKGSLIERVDQLESRLLKMEEDIENEKRRQAEGVSPKSSGGEKKKHKKGLKSFVKSCVKGNVKTRD